MELLSPVLFCEAGSFSEFSSESGFQFLYSCGVSSIYFQLELQALEDKTVSEFYFGYIICNISQSTVNQVGGFLGNSVQPGIRMSHF